jgi:hypothetical protein
VGFPLQLDQLPDPSGGHGAVQEGGGALRGAHFEAP